MLCELVWKEKEHISIKFETKKILCRTYGKSRWIVRKSRRLIRHRDAGFEICRRQGFTHVLLFYETHKVIIRIYIKL